MTTQEQVPHVVYGYRCKIGKKTGQWKIGCTIQGSSRHYQHTLGESACRLFDNYLNARKREGYSYDDVFEYFQLRVLVCTHREAEVWEDIYTRRYNAISPNGFCLKSGNYKGKTHKETKEKLSRKARKRNKHNCAGLKRRSERMKGKKQGPRPMSKETLQRRNEEREKKALIDKINDIKNGVRKKLPKLTGTDLAAFIVIKAGRPMREQEVVQEMRRAGMKVSRALTPLWRACGKAPSKQERNCKYRRTRLKIIKVEGKTMYCAKPEFTAWMIPE